jgi:NAD(P)-dependent dehydrogenase (short-subunit alcohol dehydrogenase family)/mannose-6-phosphate isomerase-like protein (cupin superfamily)
VEHVRAEQVAGERAPPPHARTLKHLVSPWTAGSRNLWVGMSEIDPGSSSNRHSHQSEECFFVVDGSGTVEVGDERERIAAGSLVLVPPDVPHRLVNDRRDCTLRILCCAAPPFERPDFDARHRLDRRSAGAPANQRAHAPVVDEHLEEEPRGLAVASQDTSWSGPARGGPHESATTAEVPDLRLAGDHAVVTGAGRGIGRASALALASQGASVTLVARSAAELEEVASEIKAAGGKAFPRPADVTDPEAVEGAIQAAAEHGELSICVNAAGLNRTGPTTELALADWELVVDTNLRGTFLVCRAVGAALLRSGHGGRIINISSQMGSVGYPGRAAYCASKHAVNGLTKALAVEWARAGITVNAVAPTFIETPMTAPMFDDPEFRDDVLRRIPIGRIGTVAEVAAAVIFLASRSASLITGHILLVDGGWVAW